MVFLAGVAAVCVDYLTFHDRERQISMVVEHLGGKGGGIGGWPLGIEHCVTFSRPLTDSELKQLASLAPIHQSRRHYISVYFKNWNPSEKQLGEARAILQAIPAHWLPSDPQREDRPTTSHGPRRDVLDEAQE
jgi:hypothetical protein